jgi:hypothetical protein
MNSFRRIFWLCGVTLLGVSLSGWGQEQQPLELGGFQTQGSATFGYRFTDVKGRVQKYNELFNLQQGPRLMDFSLFGRANEGAGRFADRWSLDLSGMGGDPFPTARFTVSKEKVYDLTVSFRKTHYYWDRNDNVIVPNIASGTTAPGFALTNNHDWSTTRQFASVDLTIHATRNLRFGFQYQRNTRDGTIFTTRTPEYFDSPLQGAFARANPYYVTVPVNEVSNRVTGSVDYAFRDWNFHYRVGYQTFEQNLTGNTCPILLEDPPLPAPPAVPPSAPPALCSVTLMPGQTLTDLFPPQRSININENATASELVNSLTFQDSRRLKTPISEFSYDGKIGSRLSLRGGYIFYRYQGPAAHDTALSGTARTSSAGTAFVPYSATESARADISEPNHVIDQGFTVKLADWVSFSTDYRYQRLTQEALGTFYSLTNGTETATGVDDVLWRIGTNILTASFELVPVPSLIIRPGVRFMKTDVFGSSLDDLPLILADDIHTRSFKSASPMISVYYRPSRVFTVRADYENTVLGTSYTRRSPHIDKSGRFVFRVQPTSKFSIEDSLFIRNRDLLDPNCENFFGTTDVDVNQGNCFENNSRTNATNVSYSFNDKFALFGGFSYDSYFATDSIHWPRTATTNGGITTSLVEYWREQYINRVWQGGLSVKAPKYVGANFSGNFVRTTGFSEIEAEHPVKNGPLIWPMITATFWFEFPKAGRLSLDLQRSYYAEEITQTSIIPDPSNAGQLILGPQIHANDFRANLLTIRWTRDF